MKRAGLHLSRPTCLRAERQGRLDMCWDLRWVRLLSVEHGPLLVWREVSPVTGAPAAGQGSSVRTAALDAVPAVPPPAPPPPPKSRPRVLPVPSDVAWLCSALDLVHPAFLKSGPSARNRRGLSTCRGVCPPPSEAASSPLCGALCRARPASRSCLRVFCGPRCCGVGRP